MSCLLSLLLLLFCFFFFQAEDGIRDHCVTGVQTCALPISAWRRSVPLAASMLPNTATQPRRMPATPPTASSRDRKSVVEGKRVDLGGGRRHQKKNKEEGSR